MTLLKGKEVAEAMTEKLKEFVKKLGNKKPCLAIIRVGERPDDIAYEKGAVKNLCNLEIECRLETLPQDISQEVLYVNTLEGKVMKMIDKDKIKQAICLLLEGIGEDADREGLRETPDRVARMYEEIFGGMDEEASAHLQKTFPVDSNEMVIEKDITFYSMCEHHLLPFFGKVHIAYIPDGKVVGISKLARTVEVYAKRLQIQEHLTTQIADALMNCLESKGVMVMVEAEHLCMTMRGIKKTGSRTISLAKRGDFNTNEKLTEMFFRMIQ